MASRAQIHSDTMAAPRRLRRGLTANAVSMTLRIATQFGLLPLLFLHWDGRTVGLWLMLYSLPLLFQTASSVFFSAAANHALSGADGATAGRAFRAGFAMAMAATATLLTLGGAAGMVALQIGSEWAATFAGAGLALPLIPIAAYVLVSVPMMALEVPLRCAGRYPDLIAMQALTVAGEALAVALAVVLLDASLLGAAIAILTVRTSATGLMALAAYRANPAAFAPIADWRRTMPELWRPAAGFMALPLAHAINLTGYTLLIGIAFGPAALAAFIATRTLVRLLDLGGNFVFAAQYYEAGHWRGETKPGSRLSARVLATSTVLAALIGASFATAMLAIGPWMQEWWTAGKTTFLWPVAAILLVAAALRLLSASPSALLSAANAHTAFASTYFAGSAIALTLSALIAAAGGDLVLVCTPMVLAELCQFIPAMRGALRKAGGNLSEFLDSLLSRERIDDLAALFGAIGWRKTSG